jgi:hypothetical protein
MFPFLGARRGKEAVMAVIRQIAENFSVRRFDRETVMLGVDSAASMLRYSLTSLESNKPISLRLAHFAQFRHGRLRSMRALLDSFDLVEQALGQSILSAAHDRLTASRRAGQTVWRSSRQPRWIAPSGARWDWGHNHRRAPDFIGAITVS